jgi:signal transduction histidine kinase
MGEMAISIAHEVRNPLGSIELFASMLRNELDAHKDLKKMAEHIIAEVKSLDHSLSNLLLFTTPQEPVFQEIDIVGLVEEFLDFIRPILTRSGVQLAYSPCPRPCTIAADRDLLKQVLLNLTLNALQAMPKGGTLTLQVYLCSEEDEFHKQWVEFTLSDEGVGMNEEEQKRIFHPFFTTKEKGTGLGLAIVHNIVESHKGAIEVRSQAAKGSSFILSFPLSKKELNSHGGCLSTEEWSN